MSAETLVERADGLVTITFNRPHRKNAITGQNWADLEHALDAIERNPEDRAVLLTGAGGNFSSGADLSGGLGLGDTAASTSEHADPPSERARQPMIHEMRNVGRIIGRLQRLPKPTVAAVDGVAVGVGLGLALACDLVIASERARFCAVYVKRGMALDGGASWSLPRTIGLRRAKQMTMFGDEVNAADALAWGLVNDVVPSEQLIGVAEAWGRRLATGPTTALGLITRLLEEGADSSFENALEGEARAQHIVTTTHDLAEGIRAYLERREPNFRGV